MIFLSLLALLYFLPTILASRHGREITGVLLLNLFLGWTVIGWFTLLIWALVSQPYYRVYPVPGAYYPPDYWRR
jgi:Superinfection immunity protein